MHEIRSIKLSSLMMSAVPLVLLLLGLFGGIVTFFVVPNPQVADLGFGVRLLTTLLFSVLYALLMDALLVVACVFYNLFTGALGLGGIRVEVQTYSEEESESN